MIGKQLTSMKLSTLKFDSKLVVLGNLGSIVFAQMKKHSKEYYGVSKMNKNRKLTTYAIYDATVLEFDISGLLNPSCCFTQSIIQSLG